jgi:hypothetical protein
VTVTVEPAQIVEGETLVIVILCPIACIMLKEHKNANTLTVNKGLRKNDFMQYVLQV